MESLNALARAGVRLEDLLSELRSGEQVSVQQLSEIAEILNVLDIDGAPQSARHVHDVPATSQLLERLTLGSVPDGLHSDVASVWAPNATRWLNRAVYGEIRRQIDDAMRDVRKVDGDIDRLEADIRLREERLETLKALADLLDALTGRSLVSPSPEKS